VDDAVRLAVYDQNRAGITYATDGEQRRQTFSGHFYCLGGIDADNPGEFTNFHNDILEFLDMRQKPTGEPIENEADNGLKNDYGTIAMARTGDPHSATAQFFINVTDNDFLNHSARDGQGWGYAVFGRVTEGEEVLTRILAVPTGSRGAHQDVPVEPVIIETVEIVED